MVPLERELHSWWTPGLVTGRPWPRVGGSSVWRMAAAAGVVEVFAGVVGASRGGGGSVQEDAALDGLPADGALAHAVPAQLAGAVAAHEDHVLEPVQTHRTHGLWGDGEMTPRSGASEPSSAHICGFTCSLMS